MYCHYETMNDGTSFGISSITRKEDIMVRVYRTIEEVCSQVKANDGVFSVLGIAISQLNKWLDLGSL